MAWTRFMDMHSGGGRKLDWEYIYIEADEGAALRIFYGRFGRNPGRVSCTCCGEDYSVSTSETLEQETAYDRGCRFDKEQDSYVEEPRTESWARRYLTLGQYRKEKDVLVLESKDIRTHGRVGEVPEEGCAWQGGDG